MSGKVPRRRNGYYYIDGKEYPSVTSILGAVLRKRGLEYWFKKMAAEVALKDPTLSAQEVIAEVDLIGRNAATRGQKVHAIAEEWARSGKWIEDSSFLYDNAFADFLDSHKPKARGWELELKSDKYIYAGRCDLVLEINGLNWLIDIKTGKEVYKEVGLQLVAYKEAIHEMKLAKINKMGVLLLKEDGTFSFHEKKDSIDDFLAVMKVWHWTKRKE